MNIIGNNLLILREALDLTQTEVSDRINISQDYISKIELGARISVGQNIIRSLSMRLGTTEEWLTKNTGWSYDPETTYKAIQFVERQINRFRPNEIIIVSYSFSLSPTADDFVKANGFIFIRPNGSIISMAGSQTLTGYSGRGPMAYRDTLIMIKNAHIKTGHSKLNKKESEYLIHADMFTIAKRSKYDKKIIDKELHKLMPDEFPDPNTKAYTIETPIILTKDEIMLLDEIRKSNADIKELIKYYRQKMLNEH